MIYITNNSGDKVATWIITGIPRPLYILIVCHGFRGAKENSGKLIPFARRLNKLGIGVVAFDFRGSGESDGDFASMTLSRQVSDLHLMISCVKESFRLPILLLGRSFGGTTVAAAAPYDKNVIGCIFWSAPLDLSGTFRHMLGDGYYRLCNGETIKITDQNGEFCLAPDIVKDFENHPLLSRLEELGDIPILAIQGGRDEVVDPQNARTLVQRAKNGKLAIMDEADHRFTEYTKERENITIQWIKDKIIN
ncbi:MAG TPA: alpha/beta fold hydrolase [Syntrophomonadaceae bacterium]|nr:alpha/beta fold hydrolase [Syntrophomonadaceae bacterium]